MPLTLEQVEDRLRVLEEENRIRREAPLNVNPFEDIAIQLALENGHTVSARTRRLVMSNRGMNSSSGSGMDFPDALTSNDIFHVPVPSDWVVGTDTTVNVMLFQNATGGSPTAVLNSFIGVEKDGDTFSDVNIENNVGIATTFTQNIVKVISRTISGGDIEAADKIQWRIERVGGHVSDDVNAPLRFRSAWIEYTAFF